MKATTISRVLNTIEQYADDGYAGITVHVPEEGVIEFVPYSEDPSPLTAADLHTLESLSDADVAVSIYTEAEIDDDGDETGDEFLSSVDISVRDR